MTLEEYIDSLIAQGLDQEEVSRLAKEFKPGETEGSAKTEDGVMGASAPSMGPVEAPEPTVLTLEDTFSELPEEIEVDPQVEVDVDIDKPKRYNSYKERMDAVGKARYKEEYDRISNLQADITEEQITEKQANDYFNLSARPFENVIDPDVPMSTRGGGFGGASELPATRKEYQPIEEYLGAEKYEQYQQYQETGELISDGTSENQATIQQGRSQARYELSKQIAELELRNVPENVQRFFGDAPLNTVDEAEGYLEFQKNNIESMAAQNKEQYASYQLDAKEIETRFDDVQRRINEVGKVDSEEKRVLYNELVTEGNAINAGYAAGKFEDRYNSIVKKQQLINSEFETFKKKTTELSDRNVLEKAASLDYSFSAKAGMAMEEFFVKDLYNNFGTLIKEVGMRGVEQAAGIQGAGYAPMFDDAVETMRQSNQNYNLQIAKKREDTIPESLKLDDIGNNNVDFFDWFTEAFADNSPSIVTTFVPGGVALKTGIAVKSAAKLGTFAAKKAALQSQRAWGTAAMYTARGAFFGGGTGGKFGDIELTEANAKLQLAKLRSTIEVTEDLSQKKKLQDEIDELERVSSFSLTQKAFTSFAFGTTEMLAESLGSLKLVTGASRVAKSMGKREFKKEIYSRPINFAGNLTGRVVSGLSPLVKGGTTELLEETVTQVAHNAIDIIALGENKSLIEGLDKDFVANVLVTSGGIMAPKTSGNILNILKNEFRIKGEVKANQELVVELVNLSSATSNMSKAEQVAARSRKSEIIEKLGLSDAMSLHKLRYMTPDQIDKAADLSRQAREIGKELFKLGSSGEGSTTPEGQRAKARLQDQLDNIIDQKESLLSAKDRFLRKEMSDFFEASDGGMQNKNGEFEYYSGLFEFYQDTAMTLMPKDGKYISIEDISNIDSDLSGFSEQAIAEVKAGFEGGARAAIIGNSIVINNKAVMDGISTANNFVDGKYAAIAPLEELFHLYNKANGVTKGGKLDKMSIAAVDEAIEVLKEKKELGQISDKEYNNLIARFELYKEGGRGKVVLKSGERGGAKVDSEEILAQINNAIALGVFNREDISNIPSLRGFINGVSNSIFGDSSWMFNLKTAEDVFKFAENFQKGIQDDVAVDSSSEEEEITKFSLSASDSAKVNELYETQGDAALMDVVDLMEPTAQGLADSYRNRPKFSEFKDQLKDEILSGKRGMMETVMGYPAYVKEKEAEKQSLIKEGKQKEADKIEIAPLSGYINNSFSTKKGFKRYIEIADRILGKDEQSQFTQEINEEATSVVDEDLSVETETVTPTKERESLRKKIALTPEVTQKVRDAVSKTFGTKLPDIDSPKFKMALQKAFRTELKTSMAKDVMGGRAAYETFLRDNFENIFKAIPQEVMNKRFKAFIEPVLDSDGKQKRESTKQGNAVFKKKPIVKAEFIKYFLGSDVGASTKGTRKDALAEALAEEFAFDATMETIQTEDVATKREFLDKGQTTEKVSKKIGRPSTMKFNKAVNNFFISNKFNESSTDFSSYNIDYTKTLNSLLKGTGVDKIDMKTESGRKRFLDFAIDNGLTKKLPPMFWRKLAFTTDNALTKAQAKELKEQGVEIKTIFTKDDALGDLREYAGNLPFKNVIEANVWISESKKKYGSDIFAKDSDFPKLKNMLTYEGVYSQKGNLENELNNSEFVKRQDNSINELGKLFEMFQNEVMRNSDGTMNFEGVAFVGALLSSSSAGQGHFLRSSAPFRFYEKGYMETGSSGNTLEHTLPATIVGKYLFIQALDGSVDENFKNIKNNYFQGPLSRTNDKKLKGKKLNGEKFNYVEQTPEGWKITDNIWARYFNINVGLNAGGINPSDLILAGDKSVYDIHNVTSTGVSVDAKAKFSRSAANDLDSGLVPSSIKYSKQVTTQTLINALAKTDKSLELARKLDQPVKKIRVFDFDDTLARTKSNVLYTMPDGTTGAINAATFAKEAGNMEAEGAQWDFSEFSKVMQGSKGPLLDVAKIIADKRGTKDVFVLTARPANAAGPIKEFLASMGLDIPLANITGLGDGAPQAKAGWVMGKAAEGYNDFYFADDHTGNVKAVKDVLSQIDVKSKVQLAKFSKSATFDTIVNDMIEDSSGIEAYKKYSAAKAKTVGASKGKYAFLIPPSAEDFTGLLYKMIGKGKKGDAQMAFLKTNLLDPYNRAELAVTQAKISAANDFVALKTQLKTLPKTLSKETGIGKFTYSHAVRVAAWTRQGMEVPGLSKRDIKQLNDFVANDSKLNEFTNELIVIQKGKQYPEPGKDWLGGNITTDIIGGIDKVNRAEYQQEFRDNLDIIFSKDNINKMEAAYGTRWREAMEDSIRRMKSGSNRPIAGNRVTEGLLTWLNNSVGAVMFLNTRSALLQTISAVNFINLSDNNIVKAGVAFANQKQFWGDFMTLMNSDYLVERRSGLKINVSESEIADAVKDSKNKPKAAISFLLSKGFVMTRFADSFAIASGGSTFYRNRLNSLLKSGMDQKAAEAKAFEDFKAIAEESQQSSSPSKISQQQASAAGRVILAWANTPMQYARIQKRSAQDLINGRGDWKTNVSKIVYYGAVQNLIFNTLQQAVFALGFGDDDEDDEKKAEKKNKKALSVANGMIDSQLKGLGVFGAASVAMKNTLMTLYEQHGKKSPKYDEAVADLLSFSPPLGSKVSKIKGGFRSFSWNRKDMQSKGYSLDNPAYLAGAQIVTGFTNVPLDRVAKKINNIRGIYSEKSSRWQKVALGLGWSTWDLDLGYYGGFDEEVEKKRTSEMTREERKEYEEQREAERAKIRKQREFERERRNIERNK